MMTIYLIRKNLTDNVNIAIKRYDNHPNILSISHLVIRRRKFSFNQVAYERIEKKLKD